MPSPNSEYSLSTQSYIQQIEIQARIVPFFVFSRDSSAYSFWHFHRLRHKASLSERNHPRSHNSLRSLPRGRLPVLQRGGSLSSLLTTLWLWCRLYNVWRHRGWKRRQRWR